MNEPILRTKNLTKLYGDFAAVEDLNLEVPEGSIFAFLGPNGAGKTTTIKMVLGLKHPTRGTVEIFGQNAALHGPRLRSRIGYVAEEPRLYDHMTVEQLHAFCRGLYPRWDSPMVTRVLKTLGVPLRRRAGDLSTGQKSALTLALAMGPHPELLILDEPTSGLDPVRRRDYYSLLVEEIGAAGTTVLLATHLLGDAERLADRVAFINRGRLVLLRDMDDLKVGEKRIRAVFQGERPEAELAAITGVRNVGRDGRSYIITTSERPDEVMARLAEFPHFTLELIDMDLEDVFLEYVREGEKRV